MKSIRPLAALALTLLLSQATMGQSISIDHVDGLNATGQIPADGSTKVKFHIRFTNDASSHGGITNGFRIYSEDGATWTTTVGDTVGISKSLFDGGFFISPFGVTGSGADTVGFSGFRFFGPGLPAAYDDIAYTIEIGPVDPSNHDKTICIDSAFYPPSGLWRWSGPDVIPIWSGLTCYRCVDAVTSADAEQNTDDLPGRFTLSQNYPNPFNPSTVIRFDLPRHSHVSIEVYNTLGQTVRNLMNENIAAGQHSVTWDGRDNSGNRLSSGVYFYKVATDDFSSSKKMLLLK